MLTEAANIKEMNSIISPTIGMIVVIKYTQYVYSGSEWIEIPDFNADVILKQDLRKKKIRRLINEESENNKNR